VGVPNDRFSWLAPAALWRYAQALIPPAPARPQGGGAQRIDEQALFAAVTYVLVTESPWRALPRVFGVSWQNTHRRFAQWTNQGLWDRLSAEVPEAASPEMHTWAGVIASTAQTRLRESGRTPHGDRSDSGDAQDRRTGPVIRKVQRSLAERLFGPLD
jgi:transposase